MSDKGVQAIARIIGIAVDDIYARQIGEASDVKFALSRMFAGGFTIEVSFAALHVAEVAKLRSAEGVQQRGVGFGYFTSAVNGVVQADQNAFITGFFGAGNDDGIVQVHRAVSAHGCRRAHGANNDNRFFAFYN